MKQKFKSLERDQIKRKLDWLYENQDILARPKRGWIRTMRRFLGMTAAPSS